MKLYKLKYIDINSKTKYCYILGENAGDIEEINSKFIKIGCHTITIKEIDSLAKETGIV